MTGENWGGGSRWLNCWLAIHFAWTPSGNTLLPLLQNYTREFLRNSLISTYEGSIVVCKYFFFLSFLLFRFERHNKSKQSQTNSKEQHIIRRNDVISRSNDIISQRNDIKIVTWHCWAFVDYTTLIESGCQKFRNVIKHVRSWIL